jgi:hypothetical protein
MRSRRSDRCATCVLALSVMMFACTKARSPEPRPEGSAVGARGPVTFDAATAQQQAPAPGSSIANAKAREEAAALQAEPGGKYEGTRDPAHDLTAQVGGSGDGAVNPERSLVVLKSHRALDPSSSDDTKVVLDFIRNGKTTVKDCYEGLRAGERGATGTITLRFTVTSSGKLADMTADSWNAELSTCVVAAMQQWTFSAQKMPVLFELVLSLVIG